MPPQSLENDFRTTYLWLRVGIAVVAFSLPLILWRGGLRAGIHLRPSMSAYYYATAAFPGPCDCANPTGSGDCGVIQNRPAGAMRDVFVGSLFAVGAMLFVYKGYTVRENIALNLAGALAIGIAMFPMNWSCGKTTLIDPHGCCAVLFFLALAYVCAVCSKATIPLLKNKLLEKRYTLAYHALAILMIASPAIAFVINLKDSGNSFIFLAEAFGIYSFALFWVVKIGEVNRIGERRAREGADPARVRFGFRRESSLTTH